MTVTTKILKPFFNNYNWFLIKLQIHWRQDMIIIETMCSVWFNIARYWALCLKHVLYRISVRFIFQVTVGLLLVFRAFVRHCQLSHVQQTPCGSLLQASIFWANHLQQQLKRWTREGFDYFIVSWLTACMVNHRLIDWSIDQLTEWLTDWLTGRLADWLTDWLID